jgi:23S rRNA pseudouridine2604 synthase
MSRNFQPRTPQKSAPMDPRVPQRISKILASRGFCSRREADDFISRGLVLLDGKPVTELGTKALPTQDIRLAAQATRAQDAAATILLNKPPGWVSAQPEEGYRPAVELVTPDRQEREAGERPWTPACMKGLAPAGRLDIDSRGLMVFTQDGRVARLLVGGQGEVEKEYLVRVNGFLSADGMEKLKSGLSLDGKPLLPAKVDRVNEDQLRFVLREGRHRQIRRMCERVGLNVVGLKRVRIGGVKLGNLPEGHWRFLRDGERF